MEIDPVILDDDSPQEPPDGDFVEGVITRNLLKYKYKN